MSWVLDWAKRSPILATILVLSLLSWLIPSLLPLTPVVAVILWGWLIVWVLYEAKMLPEGFMSILDRLTDRSRLKEALVDAAKENKRVNAEEFAAFLKERVVGQEAVCDQIAKGAARRTAMRRRGKPVYTVLLSGPTGTGKTELAKAAAEYLYEGRMFRVDCGSMQEHGISSLVGSPKGYAGSNEPGALTKHIKAFPESVILFDEVEKAGNRPDAPLNKLLLNLLDEGRVVEQSDQVAHDATGCVIILTSNAKHRELGEIATQYAGKPEDLTRATKDALDGAFAPELLARIDLVTSMAPLSDEAKAEICCVHLDKLATTYSLKLAAVEVEALVEAVRQSKALSAYGVRELIRWLEGQVSDGLIAAHDAGAVEVGIAFDGDRLTVERLA